MSRHAANHLLKSMPLLSVACHSISVSHTTCSWLISCFYCQVVTGKGKHSAGGVARLGPAVKEHVDARGLHWSEEPGNFGQINVIIAGND